MAWGLRGHDWAVELLRSHVAASRVRHAYLFTGPDGVGKRTLAVRFAQALACVDPPAAGEACGDCRPCRQIDAGTYADLHLLASPEVGASLKVEQVRELLRHLPLAPLEGRRRIALLLRFHEATPGASNALLKTLEEPPGPVVLLLTGRSVESLLPTVVSRCEVIPLRPLAHSDLKQLLEDRGLPAAEADLLAGLAGGRPGRALQLAQDRSLREERGVQLDALQSVLRGSRAERFGCAERLAKDRAGAVQALEIWQSLLRDVVFRSLGVDAPRANPDRADEIDRLAADCGADEWIEAVQAVEGTLTAVQGNANLRLALEVLSLDLPRLR